MFSFVDQISSITAGSIRGRFAVPEHFGGAPDWLLAEAIGQLAGWQAMHESAFAKRPVGATLGLLEFPGTRLPRGILELGATIERTDRRAVLYRGEVLSDGAPVALMSRCIGPLLPMETLEDPEDAKARFEALTGPHPLRLWNASDARPQASISPPELRDGLTVAEFHVAADAPFFAEHFPRQPVVPATLLIEAMCRVGAAAVALARDLPRTVRFDRVRQVKVRQFTQPGQTLRLEARPEAPAAAAVRALAGGEPIASVCVDCAL